MYPPGKKIYLHLDNGANLQVESQGFQRGGLSQLECFGSRLGSYCYGTVLDIAKMRSYVLNPRFTVEGDELLLSGDWRTIVTSLSNERTSDFR